jgi:8-amino-7-oxononanoate synthase
MGKIAEKIRGKAGDAASRHIRELSEISFCPGGKISHKGKKYVNFSSNDYLALSGHPGIADAVRSSTFPKVGTSSSRLMTGSTSCHHMLEEKTAEFKNKPAATVFNTGYQANVGVISSLLGAGDCIFSDRLNHASIVDGIRLSNAKCFRFRHNDTGHLEELVKKNRKNFKRSMIISETLFSMDGDEAPIEDLVRIKNSNSCSLMLDEAHATGIFGPRGSGIAAEKALSGDIDIIMGTFSKALGVFGAYVATDRATKNILVNKCRSFIYSTALPLPIIAGCSAAIDAVGDMSERRRELLAMASYFRAKTNAHTISGRSQIIPILAGDDEKALAFSEALRKKGWWVTAIRPPTVPVGGSRLRVSITLHHDIAMLDSFICDVEDLFSRRRA